MDRDIFTVNHSAGEYVKQVAAAADQLISTNLVETAWSMLKRSITGVHHKMSPKHLRRYVKSFAGRWNIRKINTEEQMRFVMENMLGRELTYEELTEDNGLPSGAKGGAYFPERRARFRRRPRNRSQGHTTGG